MTMPPYQYPPQQPYGWGPREHPSAYSNRGLVLAGYICGIVASCLLILTVVVLVVFLLGAAVASS